MVMVVKIMVMVMMTMMMVRGREGDHDDYGATFIIQLLILSLLLRSTSLCVALLVLSDNGDDY